METAAAEARRSIVPAQCDSNYRGKLDNSKTCVRNCVSHMHTNTELGISLRPDEAVYLQISQHIRRLIAVGQLEPGKRLPPIRSLAQQLKIDPGTVARAYRELEGEGIIVGRPGSGSFVSARVIEKRLAEQQQRRLALLVERALIEALGLGFTTEEIEASFTIRLAEWRERRQSEKKQKAMAATPDKDIRFLGSHDLAIELIGTHMGTLYPELRFSATFVGSLAGLVAVAGRQADIAGSHLLDTESGEFNTPFIRRLMPDDDVVLIHLMQRFQGLMVAPGNPKQIRDIKDLISPDITFVNRQNGSGTRILFDSQLLSLGIAPDNIRGYGHEETTHMAVASLIAQGRADAGLGAESAANVLGLDFIPILKERYDLVVLADTFARPALRRLHEVITSKSFQSMLHTISGYDVSDTGKVVTISRSSTYQRR